MHPVPYKCLVPNKCLPLSTCTWMSQNSKFYTMHEDILLANNSLISYQSTRRVNQCDWKKARFKGEKKFFTLPFHILPLSQSSQSGHFLCSVL